MTTFLKLLKEWPQYTIPVTEVQNLGDLVTTAVMLNYKEDLVENALGGYSIINTIDSSDPPNIYKSPIKLYLL